MIRHLLAAALAAAVAASAGALTNEDVVRWVAAGKPQAEILEEIAARPAAYDLSDEMIAELRLAGVPEAVLAGMRARQQETAPPPPRDEPSRGHVRLVVVLEKPGTLSVPKRASAALAERLRLPGGEDAMEVHDLAVFLACVTPEHIPDQWRTKSPLGRDLEGMPRHEMLRLVAGDTAHGDKPRIALPPQLEADVDDGEPHDLVLGVAARIGDRWRVLAFEKRSRVRVGAGTPPLTGRIASAAGVPFAFRVVLEAPQSSKDTSLETPASSIVTP